MEIRKMTLDDIKEVVELDKACFLSPWGENQFIYELNENPFSTILVAIKNNIVIGMIDYWITFEVGQINQIAVLSSYRQNGVATELLRAAFKDMVEHEVFNCTLEVRVNNTSAINFYNKHGFKTTCIKKEYYDNGDDAYYMERRMFDVYDNISN